MVTTPPQNPMQLHQNPINTECVTSSINVCRYISLETNYTVYTSLFTVDTICHTQHNNFNLSGAA